MDDAIKTAPRGDDGEAILTLSQTTGLVRRLAGMRLDHGEPDYRIVYKGQNARIVADEE